MLLLPLFRSSFRHLITVGYKEDDLSSVIGTSFAILYFAPQLFKLIAQHTRPLGCWWAELVLLRLHFDL